MPISTFFGLETTLRGILAHQQAINTTSHNVSNANTEGFSRQEAVLGATDPMTVVNGLFVKGGTFHIGTGVGVEAYRRIRDGFLDLHCRTEAMQVGDKETMSRHLDQIEISLADPSDNGISNELGKF